MSERYEFIAAEACPVSVHGVRLGADRLGELGLALGDPAATALVITGDALDLLRLLERAVEQVLLAMSDELEAETG